MDGYISRYRILQIIFIVVFFVSIFFIWNLVRTQLNLDTSIGEILQTRIPTTPTAFPATLTPTRGDIGIEFEPTAVSNNFIYYQVQEGDTLSSIATRFNVTVAILQQANQLEDETAEIGELIAIPSTGAFSVVGVAATVEALGGTQVALIGRATAVSATAEANDANIQALATRGQELANAIEDNRARIEIVTAVGSQVAREDTNWFSILTGPILASVLAFGGFLTSTWFEWRDDKREQSSAHAEIRRKKLEAELKLLNLQVMAKERELRRNPEQPGK